MAEKKQLEITKEMHDRLMRIKQVTKASMVGIVDLALTYWMMENGFENLIDEED